MSRAFTSLGERAPTTEGCPTPEAIWAAVTGEADEESVHQVIEHTSTCSACAEEWRLARGVDEVSRGETAAATPGRGGFQPVWLAAAASVTIAVAAGAYLLQRWSSKDDSGIRSAPTADIRSLVPENEALPRGRFVLRWSGGPEGATYAVRVVTEGAEEIAVVDGLTEAEYHVAPESLRGLEPGTKLLWRVQAIPPDGRRITSPTFITAIR